MADYYTDSNVPSTGAALASTTIRAEFDLIAAGFVKIAAYTGNGSKIVAINSGGTAQEAITTTGTGSGVRATSPTLVTPILGVAAATSINKITWTQPATGATVTLADGSTLATSGAYSVTLTATNTTTITLPVSGTLAILGANTFTAKQTTVATAAVAGAGFNLPHGTAPDTPANGDVWTTTAGIYVRINGATAGPFGASVAAVQSDQETAASTTVYVSPGVQQFHPSAAKAWVECDIAAGVQASYNVTSITDDGTGLVSVTIATDFSSANYTVIGIARSTGCQIVAITSAGLAAGSFQGKCYNIAATLTDPSDGYYFACFGDQ